MKQWDPKVQPYKTPARIAKNAISLSPPTLLLVGFLALILLGALLLLLPVSSHSETTPLEALFTAASAVTVTGLVVVDTGTHFTTFGQLVITALIQAGGLGFMTFAVVAALSLGANIGQFQQKIMKEALHQTSMENVIRIARVVVVYSLVVETTGFLLLTGVWTPELGLAAASYHAFFYTVSAFNNAGFALSSDSLSAYAGSFSVNAIISSLFIIGGIGFAVLSDIRSNRRWGNLGLNTRMVIIATLVLNTVAFLLIWLLESGNPNTLAGLSIGDQAIAAWFQAVTPRTAGFNTIPTNQLTDASTTLTLLLMFIGGGSLSTASGLKLGTFVILIMATHSYLKRRQHVTVLDRTVPPQQITKALSLALISIAMIFVGVFLLTALEAAPFLDIVFEVVSALSTVGLSRGLTDDLSSLGEVVIIFMMIVGRVGPLTFAYALSRPKPLPYKYADTEVQVG